MNRTYMRHGALPLAVLLLAGLAWAASPTAIAAEQPAGLEDRAAVAVHSGGVDFLPSVRYGRANLTISGNGTTFSRVLEPGRSLSIGPFDPNGQLLADGVYTWELQLTPDAATARRLRAAAASNGGKAPEAWSAQSGSFAVRGGLIADPSLAEPLASGAPSGSLGSQLPLDLAAGTAHARSAPNDDDNAVGSDRGMEARVSSQVASHVAVGASGGALQQPDRVVLERSDAATLALGGSLEHEASNDNQLSAQSRGSLAPRPRSDGSNGRPRS